MAGAKFRRLIRLVIVLRLEGYIFVRIMFVYIMHTYST